MCGYEWRKEAQSQPNGNFWLPTQHLQEIASIHTWSSTEQTFVVNFSQDGRCGKELITSGTNVSYPQQFKIIRKWQ